MANSNLQEVLAEAISRHQEGDLTGAEAGYQRVLEMDPDQPDAWHLLGVVAHQMLDGKTAIKRIRKSLEIDPAQHVDGSDRRVEALLHTRYVEDRAHSSGRSISRTVSTTISS